MINDLLCTAHKVNRETDYAVFIDDSGHVSKVEITVALSKEYYNHKLNSFFCYYDRPFTNYDTKELRDFINYLKTLLETKPAVKYKVEYDLGITQVSKIFDTQEERADWIKNAPKIVGSNVKQKEPVLTTIETQRRV